MPKIYIIDVTNRDGVQTLRICLSKLQKTIINLYLSQMGVFQSEFGFPVTHHETNYLNANLELAKQGVYGIMCLEGWIRAIEEDVGLKGLGRSILSGLGKCFILSCNHKVVLYEE